MGRPLGLALPAPCQFGWLIHLGVSETPPLPGCGGTPSCSCCSAATARQEAAPDRVHRLTNTYSSTTDPSVADPVCPDRLPEEPSDRAPTTASVVRAHHRARFCEPTTHFVILKNKQRHMVPFLSNPLAPARLFNAKLSHLLSLHEIQEIYVFVVFLKPNLEKA